ncbi:MAG TPA: carboxymuconolactone decarboxylase family protein [Anaerolineales bacterium]|nr:carboxymuconolactone decarboxylase family protein [Anaerolineales bacterium]
MDPTAKSVKPCFNKRIYTFPAFKEDVRQIFDHIDELRRAAHSGRVSKAFAEKIMLVVTAVNGCRYCSFGHSRAALAAGVSNAELKKLLTLELGDFPVEEATALAFAQHYAETACKPEPAALQRVMAYYGQEAAQDILAYLRMITFGNLTGNTFDALLSRMTARPAPHSSLRDELGVLLGVLWMPPSRLILQVFKRKQPGANTQNQNNEEMFE